MTPHSLPRSLTRRLITVLFIGQGLALIVAFTAAAIDSISGAQLAAQKERGGCLTAASFFC